MMHGYIFPLASDRLYYEPLGVKDLKAWEAFFINNDQLIREPQSPEKESKIWIERQVARCKSSGMGILGAYRQEDQRLIGNCGLLWREDILSEDHYEIGYSVMPTV